MQAQVRPEEAAEAHGVYLVPERGGPEGSVGEPQFDGLLVVLAHLSPVLRKDLEKKYEKKKNVVKGY